MGSAVASIGSLRRLRTFAAFAALAVAVLAQAQAGVAIVDAGGGGNYTTVQAAVNAASAGDIVLVRAGTYVESVTVAGKGIVIAADPAGSTFSLRGLIVSGVPAGQTFAIRGASSELYLGFFQASASIAVQNCTGAVRIEDVAWTAAAGYGGPFGFATVPGSPALVAANCAALAIVHSTLGGGRGSDYCNCGAIASYYGSAGGAGADVSGGRVEVVDSTIRGGAGGAYWPSQGYAPGGLGMKIANGAAMIAGSTIQGGDFVGDGLVVATPAAPVVLFDSTIASGSQGGAVLVAGPGDTLALPGNARHLAVTSPVREGQTVSVDLKGTGGDLVLLVLGVQGATLPVPGVAGWLLVAPPLQGPFVLAVLPPSGALMLTASAPSLTSAALTGFTSYLQAAFLPATGAQAVLGTGAALVLVDSSL